MAPEDEKEPRTKFKVEDRRRFTDEAAAKPPAPEPAPPEPATTASEPPGTEGVMRDKAPPREATELNFSTFIISLSTQAFVLLGEIPDPLTKESRADLGAARQMIDILGIVQEKTRGNLDKAESELLEGLLYDLRLRFVERARR